MTLTSKQIDVIGQMKPMLEKAPWILRITQGKCGITWNILECGDPEPKKIGGLSHSQARVCMDAIRLMLSNEIDGSGVPLEVQSLIDDRMSYIGDIPLSEEAGMKLSLLFILYPKSADAFRAELLAWRIERFTREEAGYWLNRLVFPYYRQDKKTLIWARNGLRTMLCGHGKRDEELVQEMLNVLRR